MTVLRMNPKADARQRKGSVAYVLLRQDDLKRCDWNSYQVPSTYYKHCRLAPVGASIRARVSQCRSLSTSTNNVRNTDTVSVENQPLAVSARFH